MAGAFNSGVIHLDSSPVFVFYSGQIVSGSIKFELEQPLTFSVIYIQFLGEAIVSWTENEEEKINGIKRNRVVKYEGREEYFNYTYNLAGGGNGTSQLPTGTQSIPFKFQIPFKAPSSFKGEKGQVTYSMTAHLVVPDQIHAHEVITKDFQVVAPFDLNTGSPRIKEPVDMEFDEVYGCDCTCFSSDPVTIRVRLPISGYCPGQFIPVAIQVDNGSPMEITKIVLEFLSRELYRSQHPMSEYIQPETVLTTTKRGHILGKSKRNFTLELPVPEIIPPFLENCGIIDVGYFFRITIKMSGCKDDLKDEAELCLGLIPVREFTKGEYVHPLAHSLPTGPIPDPNTSTELLLPPVTAGFRGSNTSLQRAQYNQPQSGYPNNPPPYPYPAENKFPAPEAMEMKPRPYQDIGFKAGSGPGYPTNAPGYPTNASSYPTNAPGYPTNSPGYPSARRDYPTDAPSGINPPPYGGGQPPYPMGNNGVPQQTGGYLPSAPPPN